MIHLTGSNPFGDGPGEPLGVDGNGVPTERRWIGDLPVIVHQEEIPESDITVHRGIRCTTPLRTVIDVAPDLTVTQLAEMIVECLDRRLFTVDEARRRLAQPDMADRRGAELVRRHLL
jgi:hypothetical protein